MRPDPSPCLHSTLRHTCSACRGRTGVLRRRCCWRVRAHADWQLGRLGRGCCCPHSSNQDAGMATIADRLVSKTGRNGQFRCCNCCSALLPWCRRAAAAAACPNNCVPVQHPAGRTQAGPNRSEVWACTSSIGETRTGFRSCWVPPAWQGKQAAPAWVKEKQLGSP